MPTHCKPLSFVFQACQRRRVTAAFDGGSITSNAGALLLREIDRFVGLFDRVAACFTDHRDPRLTQHSVRTLVAQRITGIAWDTRTSTIMTSCATTLCWPCWRASSGDAGRTVRRWPARAR